MTGGWWRLVGVRALLAGGALGLLLAMPNHWWMYGPAAFVLATYYDLRLWAEKRWAAKR